MDKKAVKVILLVMTVKNVIVKQQKVILSRETEKLQ